MLHVIATLDPTNVGTGLCVVNTTSRKEVTASLWQKADIVIVNRIVLKNRFDPAVPVERKVK